MTGELTKLFSRAFAIGFILPSAAYLLVAFGVLYIFGLADPLLQAAQAQEKPIFTAGVAFAVWLGAVALIALNRPIIRLLEGYGRFNPFRLNTTRLKSAYRVLDRSVADGRKKRDEARGQGRTWDLAEGQAYADALLRMTNEFPDSERYVLPTRFGNIVRAFEVYPRVIYGIESIYGWGRLLGVLPAEYRDLIDNEKAQLDFWINLWLGSWLTAILYAVLAAIHHVYPAPWIPVIALVVAFATVNAAYVAAQSWGALVTSAFDLHRGALCQKLGLRMPDTIEQERELWQCVSQVWIYRSAETMERLNKYRMPNDGAKDR